MGPLIFSVQPHFYPRSPCGERLARVNSMLTLIQFLSTLSLRRATLYINGPTKAVIFLSTLSLRRATLINCNCNFTQKFLSTLSLRRATDVNNPVLAVTSISIHALLAESDVMDTFVLATPVLFLSTLSLRRATDNTASRIAAENDFYPRSPCGERRQIKQTCRVETSISIHALLAESDVNKISYQCQIDQFLSTLSLRRATGEINTRGSKKVFLSTLSLRRATDTSSLMQCQAKFLSTLSLRRATWLRCWQLAARDISIHALLAESDGGSGVGSWPHGIFLSTLSLRRATEYDVLATSGVLISIHALLAESDQPTTSRNNKNNVFLSTLSLRRATTQEPKPTRQNQFLSTLSLRRATRCRAALSAALTISIHALLAESDRGKQTCCGFNIHFYPRSPCGERPSSIDDLEPSTTHFYPRSPCGERPCRVKLVKTNTGISIHALLAESDRRGAANCYLDNIISIHALLAESDANSQPERPKQHISIHALLAESDVLTTTTTICIVLFLSTLSLRRATCV